MEHPPPPPDWAALPTDILLDIFLRLGPREVMLGAELACKAWRSVALEESALWRRVGVDPWDPSLFLDERWRRVIRRGLLGDMMLLAVDRAKGQCEVFMGYCNSDSLLDLVGRAPALKSLNMERFSCHESGESLVEALQKLTRLEDLEIDFRHRIDWYKENALQSVCQACPRLEKLVVRYASAYDLERNEDEFQKEPIDGPIPVMAKLHTLELYDCNLSTKGLNAILDSCPLLETLHIGGYFHKRKMGKELWRKCRTRVKNITLDTRKKPPSWYSGGYKTDEFYAYSSDEYSGISSLEEDFDLENDRMGSC
ncbi:unnamed protein product [Urochloa decumbens]|uniref:F-box domain-containing protein n=1 Tax=Urochloa decumbens TaxID=240449 RepID=A0ABC9BTQ0_9POAL